MLNIIFEENIDIYNELKNINNLLKIRNKKMSKPILIEFLGSARSGKSTAIEKIVELFRKYNISVEVIDEEYIKITKDINKNPSKKQEVNSLDYTNKVIEEKISIFDYAKEMNADVIIFDRGINDEFNWLKTFGEEDGESYNIKLGKRKVDLLIIETCDVMTSLKRKYQNSLSLMPTKWTNYEICTEYLKSIEKNYIYFNEHSKSVFKIDTSNIKAIEACIQIIKEILKVIL